MTYFDSCYLAKLYLAEPDSAAVRSRAEASGDLVSCHIAWGEILAALHRHLREGRLSEGQFRLLARQVANDVEQGIWIPLPVTASLVRAQTRRMAALSGSVFLRAADALHLSCAAEAGLCDVYTGDRHMIAAATHFGLRAVTL